MERQRKLIVGFAIAIPVIVILWMLSRLPQ
jgi:hypothetical protein